MFVSMGKASKRKQSKTQIIETLTSAEFLEHVQKTLMGIPLKLAEPIIAKLIENARQGVTDKWFGIKKDPLEFRIGYESDGGVNCYTMIIHNGVGHCYDFDKTNSSMRGRCVPLIPCPPEKTSIYQVKKMQ